MWVVGFYLSKCSEVQESTKSLPPSELQVRGWAHAYAAFYRHLAEGREMYRFVNSLKNARDTFDAHLGSGRVGWRQGIDGRDPANLPKMAERVMREWDGRTRADLWLAIKPLTDPTVANVPDVILKDLLAETNPDTLDYTAKTEGGLHVILSTRIERDPSLRAAALGIHGTRCQVCGFDFGDAYGAWGRGFAVVHHLRMLSNTNHRGNSGVR